MEILAAIVIAAIVITWVVRSAKPRGSARRYKCHGCQHLRRAFDDGVLCGYGTRETFKTLANIRMCGDWEAAKKR